MCSTRKRDSNTLRGHESAKKRDSICDRCLLVTARFGYLAQRLAENGKTLDTNPKRRLRRLRGPSSRIIVFGRKTLRSPCPELPGELLSIGAA
jgi:hypothetical protein